MKMTRNKSRSGKKSSGSSRTASKKITKRVVDVRRHTKGYIVGGKEVSVPQARRMAAAGNLRGVQVVGNHIQAIPGQTRLSELPMMIKTRK